MGRGWRPLVAGAMVVVAVFLLAQWPIFEPSASAPEPGGTLLTGAERGAVLYENECSSCHGTSGEGGIGPPLADSGLDEVEIASAIERGGGGMPPAIVTGQNAEDVTAYVASIAG
jgi:cytochrome c550